MQVLETDINGVKIIQPQLFQDERGCFMETYHREKYEKHGIPYNFVQDNFSVSRKNVLRGLHLQNPTLQGKLVMVLSGAVLDVAIDVRVGSPTFGRHVSVVLDSITFKQFWIPRGFAHGFVALSEETRFLYKCDAHYDRDSELSIRWNDPDLDVKWGIEKPIISDKDASAPFLRDITAKLPKFQG